MSGPGKSGRRPFRVAIVGAGFGGIAAAAALHRKGIGDVTIFERSAGIGGTWWHNRYPGAATDAASHLYSYSFAPYDWDRTHVGHAAIQHYLEHVIDRLGLRPHIRLGTGVVSAVWDTAASGYRVTLATGEAETFDAVVSAVGFLSKPRFPTWPGLDAFAGEVVHSAEWRGDIALDGRKVAVVGTGSSAAQVVPAIVDRVGELTLFQREPGWLLPKNDRPFQGRERSLLKLWPLQKLYRLKLYLKQEIGEWNGRMFKPGTPQNSAAKKAALDYLDEVFADRPDLKAIMTPDYPYAGKRTVVSSDFYPALLKPNVTVVPRTVVAVEEGRLVDSAGGSHAADLLILCTGFEATEYQSSLTLVGRDGRSLRQAWNGEPNAFLGLMVPGFPNFFMLYGPNTNGGFIISNLERQARFAAEEIARLARGRTGPVEVTEAANRRYNDWLQTRMAGTAYAAGNNYYKSPTGRIVTQWPDNATQYAWRLLWLRRFWNWRRKTDAGRQAAPVSSDRSGP